MTSAEHSLFFRLSVHSAIQNTIEYSAFFKFIISKCIKRVFYFIFFKPKNMLNSAFSKAVVGF